MFSQIEKWSRVFRSGEDKGPLSFPQNRELGSRHSFLSEFSGVCRFPCLLQDEISVGV